MPLLRQLEFAFESLYLDPSVVGQVRCLPQIQWATQAVTLQFRGRDAALIAKSRHLLRSAGADKLAREVCVEWNPRLQTAAGRADYRARMISLNPRICEHGEAEVDRTLRHELAHLLAQFRAGRRRILPHGPEWRDACVDLGIANEARCHNLPFAARTFARRFVYHCPNCHREFPRTRRIRRALACLACCRAYNGGDFEPRFRLQLIARDCRGVPVKRQK